jgi:S1-C subfamily serine protease
VVSSEGGPLDGSGERGEGGSDPHGPSADDQVVRGWLPPEQRAWRHPSEMGSRAGPSRPLTAELRRPPSGRRTAWATTLVGAGAVVALVSGGLMLASQSGSGPGDGRTGLTAPPAAATRSIVRLDVVSGSSINGYGCGIVVAPGGLIATDASLLVGVGRIVAITSSGRRETATVVAVDPGSDVGLVKVSASLPVARVVDWSDLQPGANAEELAVETRTQGNPTSTWWSETIASASAAVGAGPGQGMASVVTAAPSGVRPVGAVLMESDGAVVGLLDRSGVPPGGGGAVFLPGQFVVQVAQELMTDNGKIQHGWLGIKGSDSTSGEPKGALVTSVDPDGASAGHLEPGDVIEAIDGHRVRSMADLRSRLYLLGPGSWVDIRVDRDRTVETVGLDLLATS